jgi:hypothetical protein
MKGGSQLRRRAHLELSLVGVKDDDSSQNAVGVNLDPPPAGAAKDDTPQGVMLKIQALQNLMTDEQSKLILSAKATIDPGYASPDRFTVDPDESPPTPSRTPSAIHANGLIASLAPSKKQLQDMKWIPPERIEDVRAALTVKVYLDFEHASPKVSPVGGVYVQTAAPGHDGAVTYREPSYVPVLVWRGDKDAAPNDEPAKKSSQLLPPQTVAFAQFGVVQTMPYKAQLFKNKSWEIKFAEDGQITSASFASKAWGANATSVFGGAASAANSIGSEIRTADNPATQAALIQGQADLVYQTRRLALCQADATSCPSK